MKSNKRVFLVNPMDITLETKCENLKIGVMNTLKEQKKIHGNTKFSNLPENEKEGLVSTINNVNENRISVFPTDKSKRFSVDTFEGYDTDMRDHIDKHDKINEKTLKKTIKNFNESNKSFVKILGIGKNCNQDKRASRNVHVHYQSEFPVISGHHKDHKEGRKKRLLVNGNVGPVFILSDNICDVLDKYVEELKDTYRESTCSSTEELLSSIIKYNETINQTNPQNSIASLDINSLFPSLKTEKCCEKVRSVVLKSKLKIEGLDIREMAIYLRKNMTTEEISRSNFKECIPIRLKKPKDVNVTDVDLWQFADHTPNDIEIKHMWAETLASLVKLAMNNHIFMYGHEIIIQKN